MVLGRFTDVYEDCSGIVLLMMSYDKSRIFVVLLLRSKIKLEPSNRTFYQINFMVKHKCCGTWNNKYNQIFILDSVKPSCIYCIFCSGLVSHFKEDIH